MKRNRTICKKKKRNALEIFEKESIWNFIRGITTADFAAERKDYTDVDEDKCFLLSLLPPFRQYNDEQKFLARMEILKIMQHFKVQQNWDSYSSFSLPSFSNANNFVPNLSHFPSNPQYPQTVTSMQNSEILSQYLSN